MTPSVQKAGITAVNTEWVMPYRLVYVGSVKTVKRLYILSALQAGYRFQRPMTRRHLYLWTEPRVPGQPERCGATSAKSSRNIDDTARRGKSSICMAWPISNARLCSQQRTWRAEINLKARARRSVRVLTLLSLIDGGRLGALQNPPRHFSPPWCQDISQVGSLQRSRLSTIRCKTKEPANSDPLSESRFSRTGEKDSQAKAYHEFEPHPSATYLRKHHLAIFFSSEPFVQLIRNLSCY